MEIKNDHVVLMHYTLKNDQGNVLDSSAGREPLAYLHGAQNIITGLETELTGKKTGDKFTAVIEAKDGYGERMEEMVHVVPKANFRGDGDLQVGMQVQLETSNGPAIASVSNIEGDDVTLDLNHPLAGERLHFDIEVVEVREATQDELSHGHAHGEGGHEH